MLLSIYKKANVMISQEPVLDSNPNTSATNKLQSFKKAFVVPINFPCVNCIENILYVGDLYDLNDFYDNKEIYVRKVRFLNAYIKSNHLTIVVLDLKKGKILTRSRRINNDILPCNWMLTDFLNPEPKS